MPLRAPRTRLVVLSQPSAGDGEGFVASRAQRAMRRLRRAAGAIRGPARPAGPPEVARAPAPAIAEEAQAGGISAGWSRVVSAVRGFADRVLRFFGLR